VSTSTQSTVQKVSVLTLTGVVVGSMVGGGVFTLPSEFGAATGVLGAVIAWVIAGTGMLMLAFVFQSLAVRRPDLDSGVYIYAQAGFGNYAGFNSAFGYWASNVAGNVFFMVFTMTSLGAFFPGLGQGSTVLAVLVASAGVWFFHVLIARGVRQATAINRIVTVAKLIPILVFIVIALLSFEAGTFADNFWGGQSHTFGAVFDQVKDTMLVTTFVFLGIEGASVFSRLARRREDVGRATLLGFLSVLALFASVTLVSYGVMPKADLASAKQPAMGSVLESVVGPWGSTFVSLGVIISVQGAYLAWTLINAEVLYMPATTDVMPKFLARNNKNATPIAALISTNIAVQILLLLVLFVDDALDFMLKLDTALSLVPYLLAAGYALKLTITGETYGLEDERERRKQRLIATTAVIFSAFLLYSAGAEYLLLACIVYAPGTLLYAMARREQRLAMFNRAEALACALLCLAGVVGVVVIATGYLKI
jgi:arginine:ornithine antiporter / lysine permease